MKSMQYEKQVAKIIKPLKYIRENDGMWVVHPKQGKIWEPDKLYKIALLAAKAGNGLRVNQIAFGLLKAA